MTSEPLTPAAIVAHQATIGGQVRLRPDYDAAFLAWLFAELDDVASHGRPSARLVRRHGEPIGWHVGLLSDNGVMEVLQLAADAGAATAVIDNAVEHARQSGAAVIRGRLEPPLVHAATAWPFVVWSSRTQALVHARDPQLVHAVLAGDAFLTRLEGEWWMDPHLREEAAEDPGARRTIRRPRPSGSAPAEPGLARVVREAWSGSLPPRYDEPRTRVPFERAVRDQLRPGQRILDMGSGANPLLLPEDRPPGVRYEGLDISAAELAKAPAGSYDAALVADAVVRREDLVGRYDLIVSHQVLEHVRPLPAVLENLRAYLVPGGTFVTKFSGAFSIFALLNRMVPHRVAVWALHRFLGDDPERVFPAHYDQCWDAALRRLLAPWSSARIDPLYMGAEYLSFLRPAQALYVGAEEWWARRDIRDLAAYYIVTATR